MWGSSLEEFRLRGIFLRESKAVVAHQLLLSPFDAAGQSLESVHEFPEPVTATHKVLPAVIVNQGSA